MEEYRVMSVQPLGKKKYKIILEGTQVIVFSVYPSELKKFGLKENAIISSEEYKEIRDILYKRGKERALYYLKTSDKTISQMRTKLKDGFYPEDIIESVVDFLKNYGYIDDYRYTQNYVSYSRQRKSIRCIRNDLVLKGISKEIIEEVILENSCDSMEEQLIEEYCRKKIRGNMDEKQYNKLVMSLMRKGFKYEQVRSVIRKMGEETTS